MHNSTMKIPRSLPLYRLVRFGARETWNMNLENSYHIVRVSQSAAQEGSISSAADTRYCMKDIVRIRYIYVGVYINMN